MPLPVVYYPFGSTPANQRSVRGQLLQHRDVLALRQKRDRWRSKRSGTGHETDDGISGNETERSPSFSPLPDGIQGLVEEESAQYLVAGLSTDRKLPPPPFPHAPLPKPKRRKLSRSRSLAADSALDTSGTAAPTIPEGRERSQELRDQHMSVVTTILHRSLLDGDYERAGRAWAILIRSFHRSDRFDVRQNMYWGIGAELLLHRSSSGAVVSKFTDEGFVAAREYYNELIRRFENRSRGYRPKFDYTKDLYVAMFNLWIMEVTERSRRAQEAAGKDADSSRSDATSSTNAAEFDLRGIRARELSQGRAIAKKLERVLANPILHEDPDLRHIQRNVTAWLSDLEDVVPSSHRIGEDAGSDSSAESGGDGDQEMSDV